MNDEWQMLNDKWQMLNDKGRMMKHEWQMLNAEYMTNAECWIQSLLHEIDFNRFFLHAK